jgi:hypothetical protein
VTPTEERQSQPIADTVSLSADLLWVNEIESPSGLKSSTPSIKGSHILHPLKALIIHSRDLPVQ